MAWSVEPGSHPEARALGKLGPQATRRILAFLNDRVARLDDPRGIGEAPQGLRLLRLLEVSRGRLSHRGGHRGSDSADPRRAGGPSTGNLRALAFASGRALVRNAENSRPASDRRPVASGRGGRPRSKRLRPLPAVERMPPAGTGR